MLNCKSASCLLSLGKQSKFQIPNHYLILLKFKSISEFIKAKILVLRVLSFGAPSEFGLRNSELGRSSSTVVNRQESAVSFKANFQIHKANASSDSQKICHFAIEREIASPFDKDETIFLHFNHFKNIINLKR